MTSLTHPQPLTRYHSHLRFPCLALCSPCSLLNAPTQAPSCPLSCHNTSYVTSRRGMQTHSDLTPSPDLQIFDIASRALYLCTCLSLSAPSTKEVEGYLHTAILAGVTPPRGLQDLCVRGRSRICVSTCTMSHWRVRRPLKAVRGMCFGQRLLGCISSARQRAMPFRRRGVDGQVQGYAPKRKEQEIVSDLVLPSQLTPTSTVVTFRGRRR